MRWTTTLHGCPSQSYTFVQVAGVNYALFLSHRPDSGGWRAFVVPSARRQGDLYQARWSRDLFADSGLVYPEAQLAEAQTALVRILASQLGVAETDITTRRRAARQSVLSGPQMAQIARIQPRRK